MVITTLTLALILLVGSFGCCTVLTWLVKKHSEKTGFVARPQKERYHRDIIALGGGVAIFWTILLFILCSIAIVKFVVEPGIIDFISEQLLVHKEGFITKIPQLFIIAACATALHILGFIDDKKHLGPYLKLFVQFAVAGVAVFLADVRVELFIENRILTGLMSMFWIVLMMNAFNFMDNMDGLTAGIAAIACSVLLTSAVISGQYFIGAFTIVFIGTLLGFLVFNFPPAKIFMGDAGSLIIGFFTAMITLRTTYYHEGAGASLYTVFMPLVVMAVPLYDFTSVTILRISQGKSPFVGDTQHFSHRLKRRGLNDTQVALTLYLATLCTGCGAIFLYSVNLLGAIIVFVQTVMILCIIAILEMSGKNAKTES